MSSSPTRARSPSPSHGPRRPTVSPPKPIINSLPSSNTTFSPRRPTTIRGPGDGHHAAMPPSMGSRLATSLALASQDTLASVAATRSTPGTATASQSGSNPHVRAIQSRVEELVRRFDESVASSSGDDDEDDDPDTKRLDVPTRWRVGDVLLATHSALSKTSTRTERSMITDFGDDSDIMDAIGDGEQSFSLVLEQAAQKAEQMKAVLNRTLNVVKQMQLQEEIDEAASRGEGASAQQNMRDLKITVQALHKEKSMLIAQLHEHIKSHKEMLATMEDQNQELKKAQIAAAMKNDELKGARDDFAFRINDLQKMSETSQQNVTMWRDKYQGTLKTLGDAEARITELEGKIHAQAEEVMKHAFILRAKNSELEKYKERLKESEAARMKAEASMREATAAAAASAAEAAAATKRAEAASKAAKTAPTNSDSQGKMSSKEKLDLEAKIRQQDLTIRDLQLRLNELTSTRSKFEDDNNELARIVRELQARAQEMMDSRPVASGPSPLKAPPIRRATSFSLSLKRLPGEKKTDDSGSSRDLGQGRMMPSDDLSTSSGDEGEVDSETERDEQELNETVQQVVTSMFPVRVSSMEEQSDDLISNSIAEYEANPMGNPLQTHKEDTITARLVSTPTSSQRPASRGSILAAADGSSTVPLSELEQLHAAHADEIARLKKQYVTGLLEYKKLVIEQYERRQNEIQQHHRIEIENLILLVQDKFKRELERRGERVLQAKESLKLLYRAMRMGDGSGPFGDKSGRRGSGGLSSLSEDSDNGDVDDGDRDEEPVPLKSILRAAVFAMSTSKRRNEEGSSQISTMYERVGKKSKSPQKPVVKVVVTREKPLDPPLTPEAKPDAEEHDWAAFIKSMRANREDASERSSKTSGLVVHVACQVDARDFVIFDLKGLRGSHVSPENVEDYVLPSLALLGGSSLATDANSRALGRHNSGLTNGNGNGNGVLSLTEGALLADSVVRELRGLLPFLPPGAYYLSGALRHQLMIEMLRFYSDLGRRNALPQHQNQLKQSQVRDGEDTDADVEVLLGSPRDTPFLRRKAVEGVARARQQQRRDQLSNGALAMLQPPPSIATANARAGHHGFVASGVMGPMSNVRLR